MKLLCTIFGLLLLSLSSVIGQAGIYTEYDIEIQNLFMDAQIHKYTNNEEKEIEILKEVIKIDKQCHAAHYELAQIHLEKEDLESAEKYATRAFELKREVWYGKLLTQIYQEQYNYLEAEKVLEQLLILDHSSTEHYNTLARLQLLRGDAEAALLTLNQLEKEKGITEDCSRKKFEIYVNSQKEKEAIFELEQLIETQPKNTRYLNNLASYYLEIGQSKKANDIFQKVLKLDPSDTTANLAMVQSNDNPSESQHYLHAISPLIENESIPLDAKIKELIPYIQKMPNNPEDPKNLALLSNAEILSQKYPNEAKAHSLLADVYYNLGKSEKALKHYKQAIELNENVFSIWRQCLATMYELSDYENLESYSIEALDYFPNQFDVYFFRAIALDHLKMKEDFLEIKEEAQFVAGKSVKNNLRLAAMSAMELQSEEKTTEAIALLEKQNYEDGNFPYVLEILGDLYSRSGQIEKALSHWQKAFMDGNRSLILEEKIAQKKFIE